MPEDNTELPPDVPTPTTTNEEIVDPTTPLGSGTRIILHRHPFGLVALYLQVIIGLVIAFGLLLFLVPELISGETADRANGFIILAAFGVSVLALLFLFLATIIYRQNKWIITDDSITQVLQKGLFRRLTSELSMANIEDVSSEQLGIVATAFGFGLLKVETAGEASDFHFLYCPKPEKYAQIILHARERYIEGDPEQAKRANELLHVPRA